MIKSFPPVLSESPKILILGTMPSVKSLETGEYYAHPQNLFWRVMGAIFSFSPSAPYPERISALKQNGIALWDVLERCERQGSGDDRIKNEKPNPVGKLLADNSSILAVLFNGHPAEKYFCRYFPAENRVCLRYLPSTSPRYAVKTFEQKATLWRRTINLFL